MFTFMFVAKILLDCPISRVVLLFVMLPEYDWKKRTPPPPVKVKSPSGDRFPKVSCPTAVTVALGAKVKEFVALIVRVVVLPVFVRPPIV